MSQRYQNIGQILTWLLVILGLFSLLYYGASNYYQPAKIETVTTQSPKQSIPQTQNVNYPKVSNKSKIR